MERVRVRAARGVGVEAVFLLVIFVVLVVLGKEPGRFGARENAQEQGEDQGQQPAGTRTCARDRRKGGAGAREMGSRSMGNSENIYRIMRRRIDFSRRFEEIFRMLDVVRVGGLASGGGGRRAEARPTAPLII
jgi:hypothetical protein